MSSRYAYVQFCIPLPSLSLRDNFGAMPFHSREKVGRNDPCPCGSGRKYKHCCLRVAPASDGSPWSRQREASDRLTGDMQDFASRKFGSVIGDAWEDFNQTALPPPYEKNQDEVQIFLPYFLFEWDPERPARRRGGQMRGGLVGRSYLEKAGSRLSELEALIFNQATTQPVSFYEVHRCEPGGSLVLRDILIGGETTVVERSASQMLRPGDIAYAQIWRLPEVATLGRLAPIPIPPRNKAEIVGFRAKLRKKIAKQNRELDAADLVRYAEEIRTQYLNVRDALRLPPRLCNTDGDPILFHTMTFRIGSAHAAFEALSSLAWGSSKEELLDNAELDADGTLRSVEIEWTKKGNRKFKTWENTILGRIRISGRSLIAEVNSQNRATRLRQEIEQRLGILAVHQSTVTQTPEDLMKDRELQKAAGRSASEMRNMLLDPEVREQAETLMQKQVESWVYQKIPALGGRAPIEAVADPDGKEIVEGLLLDWERQNERPTSPETIRPDINAVRRLLNLPPSED